MRIITFSLLLLLGSNISYAQGIQFENGKGLSWQQIKEKAKAENKFIFVDGYATWCGPCKDMDLTVYPTEKVGAAMKDNFLSVKIQFDVTDYDKEEVKQWYSTARALEKEYKIGGFPTYLFFSPQGKLVYQTGGAKGPNDFVKMVSYAMTDPIGRVTKLMADYREGKKDYSGLPALIEMTRQSGDNELATAIVKDYKANYLDKLKEEELTSEHIKFLISNYVLLTSKDNFFNLMYNQPAKVDSAWDYPIARDLLNHIVSEEEIVAKLWKNEQPIALKPDWQKLEAGISEKYKKLNATALVSSAQSVFYNRLINSKLWNGNEPITKNPDWGKIETEIARNYNKEAAKSMVTEARLNFYKRTGNWKEYARLKNQAIKENPPKAMPLTGVEEKHSWKLNVDAWDVFKFSTDKDALTSALSWSELSIKLAYEETPKEHPLQLLDTKANLLYKLGRVEEAIALQEKIIELTNGKRKFFADKAKRYIDKMRKGEPTWDVK